MRRVSAALVALTAATTLLLLAGPASAGPRSFDVEPSTVHAGQGVKAFGEGCEQGDRVLIKLDDRLIAIDQADSNGRFLEGIDIPLRTSPGNHRMRASCGDRRLGSERIRVLRSQLNVSPRTVEQGDKVTVSGDGCGRGAFVRILLDGRTIDTDHANRRGFFSENVLIPSGTPVGRHVISARCSGHYVGFKSIRVIAAYPTPLDLVSVSHSSVRAGQAVTVNAADCPNKAPTASLDGQPVALTVNKIAKGKGVTATATIPRSTAPGKHRLSTACDAGSAGTTDLQVLDADTTESAATTQAFGSKPVSELALWAGLVAGLAVLVASLGVGRRRRSRS